MNVEEIELGRAIPKPGSLAFGIEGFEEVPSHLMVETENGVASVPNPEFKNAPLACIATIHPQSFSRL